MGSWQQTLGRAWNTLMFGKASRSKAERESETALLRADAVDKSKARALRQRSGYYLNHQLDLGVEAIRLRGAFFERHGSIQGWLKLFVARRFDLGEAMSRASRAAYNQVKCAVRTVQGDRKEAGAKGKKQPCWHSRVAEVCRQRRRGGGRTPR